MVQNCSIFFISGRQFEYGRALDIMQNEEYLDDSDFNDIKRNYIEKKISHVNPYFDPPNDMQYSGWKPIRNEKSNYMKYSDDEEISYYPNSHNKLKNDNNAENEETFINFSEVKLRHRQKRQGKESYCVESF